LAGLILLCPFTLELRALDPARSPSQYQYSEWNMTHGLPYSAVRSIYQTQNGYLWLATRAGISRFDGVTFTNFSAADIGGNGTDEVTFFGEDNEHRLWVGTRKGVLWYENDRWSKPMLGAEIDQAEITGLLKNGDGMYIATGTQVLRWEKGGVVPINLGIATAFNWYFQAFRRAWNGDLLVIGDNLIRIRKNGSGETLDHLIQIPDHSEIRDATEDRDGGVWIGTKTGLYRWKDDRVERFPETNGVAIEIVRSLCFDRDDNLWIGTPNGLLRYRQGKVEAVSINGTESLSHILCITEDIEGNLWCGTDGGLMRLHDAKITNLTVHDGLPTSSIATIIKSRAGGEWVGTLGGGLVRMQQNSMRIYNKKSGLGDNFPLALCEDTAGGLWIGYYSNGLDYLRPDGTVEHHHEITNTISGVVELSPGDVWVASWEKGGLYQLRDGVFTLSNAFRDAYIRAMTRDSKGRLWVAWDRGVAVLENEKWSTLDVPTDPREKKPTAFHEAADGSMWLLRDDFELQRFLNGKLQRLALPDVVGRLAYGLTVRDDEVWLSVRNGILRVKTADLEAAWNQKKTTFAYTLYNESDGMRSTAPDNRNPSSIVDLGAGGIRAATAKGLVVIHPELIRINKIPPNVIIESIETDRRKFTPAPSIHLPAGRGELAFHFTALSLGDTKRVLFKYQLEGYDHTWVDARRVREAHYGGVPPGTYRFHVIACNDDGLWNETGASCEIVIEPHAYETWWFWTLSGIGIVGAFSLLFWLRTRQLRKRQHELVKQVDERTKDLKSARDAALAASKAKSDFVANMSHEIRTPMNGVIGLTELALNLATNKEQSSYLRTVLASGDALMTVINDILDFSKIESGKLTLDLAEFSLTECVQNVVEPIAVLTAQKQLELLCEIDPRIPQRLVGDKARLRQVLFNILGNAKKFTEQGQISLTVSTEGGDHTTCPLQICVADSGIGIAAGSLEEIFQPFVQADGTMTRRFGGTGLGLTISRQLIELMGGKIWVESKPGVGSRFHIDLSLPVGNGAPSPSLPELHFPGPALVIDDHPEALKAIEKLLAEFKIAILPASNATQAQACLRAAKTAPSLLIVDEQLGDADGYDAIALVRKTPGYAKIPAILLLSSDRPNASELSIEFRLRKPVFRRQLFDVLNAICNKTGKTSTAPLPAPRRLRSLKVLVAEDAPVNQLVVRKMLELGGHSVEIVGDGNAAVERYRKGDLDLILMDVQMPELDGREATVRIRQLEADSGKRIPIVALTAHAMQGDAELCLAAGMNGYLTKPLKRQDLTKMLERLFLPAVSEETITTAKPG
jgi:signal transduction histidine kinase/CheY-like chemotaxis protein/ligand-binding sensor domain-containing protein